MNMDESNELLYDNIASKQNLLAFSNNFDENEDNRIDNTEQSEESLIDNNSTEEINNNLTFNNNENHNSNGYNQKNN